jgi:hypothetical protein
VSGERASSRRCWCTRTARHGACNVQQQVRRHPWRESHFLQAGQAPRRAGTADPWPASFGCGGFVPDAQHPCFAMVSFSVRSSWKRFYASQQQAPGRLGGDMKGHRKGFTVGWQINPPSPFQGGYERPSNITRGYAQYQSGTFPRPSVGATSLLCASPHNRRYVKWPRR